MYDPFKRARTRAGKRIGRQATSAFTGLVKAMQIAATPAKPAKPAKAAKPKTTKPAPPAAAKPGAAARPTVPARSRAGSAAPRGALFIKASHQCEFGERSFRLYVPAAARGASAPLPLLVMLHGCGQTPEDFARGTGMNALAEEIGYLVLYPAQPRRSQVNRCWNWYRPDDQARGAGEPALIASLVRRIIDEQGADPARIYVAGLSAGASAALILAQAYPDLFAAVGAHSGLPVGAAHNQASAGIAMRHGAPGLRTATPMPTISFHGDADTVVNPRNGRFVVSRALEHYPGLSKTEKTGRGPGGRSYVRISHRIGRGRSFVEHWLVLGTAHAWSGGTGSASYCDPDGPDASREMLRFFLRHRTTAKRRAHRPG